MKITVSGVMESMAVGAYIDFWFECMDDEIGRIECLVHCTGLIFFFFYRPKYLI